MPISSATAIAVNSWSPVHIHGSTPIFLSARMVDRASDWIGSAIPSTATTRLGHSSLLHACNSLFDRTLTYTPTCPFNRRVRISSSACPSVIVSSRVPWAHSLFPTRTCQSPHPCFCMRHDTPDPGTIDCSVNLTSFGKKLPHLLLAALTMAVASGCSLFNSAQAANHNTNSLLSLIKDGTLSPRGSFCVLLFCVNVVVVVVHVVISSVTFPKTARPVVTVPVLSKMTTLTPCALSKTAPPLINNPLSAPTPVPTMTAVGVANPRAQGQATTITAIPDVKAAKKRSSCLFQHNHAKKVMVASVNTMGAKTQAIASACAWMGAFLVCASSTRRTIFARTVPLPVAVTLMSIVLNWLTVDPNKRSPAFFATGKGSPERADSSTKHPLDDSDVAIKIPSVGIRDPGGTTK
mmetsp:Transcript_175/g.270  ORF Transcript_175/g.270 Transcript_175/m.270 type:complete len:407 (-) Transcript_175:107-1327(-)